MKKLRKGEKNILISSLSVIGLGTILGTSLVISENLKSSGNKSLIDNTINQSNEIFTGEILTNEEVQKLGWDKKTQITLADWKRQAPNVIRLGTGEPSSAPFYINNKLESIEIPSQVIEINHATFYSATSLRKVSFENNSSLTNIGELAFNGSAIEEITIPKSVSKMGANSFGNTAKLVASKISIPEKLKQNSSTSLYGFDQDKWSNINWISNEEDKDSTAGKVTPFEGKILTKSVVQSLGWDQKERITLADWQRDAPHVVQISNSTTFGNGLTAAFINNQVLTSIEIPAKITRLNYASFYAAQALSSITFESRSRLDTIEKNVFVDAGSLASISLPNSVKQIGDGAFTRTDLLTGPNISMPIALRKNSEIPLYGFSVIQWPTINWRTEPFRGDTLLKANVVALGWDKKSIITLQDWEESAPNVTKISTIHSGENAATSAFSNNTNIQSIQIPAKVTEINDSSFWNATALSSVTFESNSMLNRMGNGAFRGTTSLRATDFSSNARLTAIGDNVFNSSGITSINLPKSVTTIGLNVFTSTRSLNGANVSISSKLRKSLNTLYGFSETQWNAIAWRFEDKFTESILNQAAVLSLGWDRKTRITLSDWTTWAPNVTTISPTTSSGSNIAAFSNLTTIQQIDIPANVTTINYGSFLNASSLTTITFANNSKLTSIGEAAFLQTALTTITLPAQLATIGSNAFEATQLATIAIPASVRTIGNLAFNGLSTLKTITFPENSQLTSIGNLTFQNTGITAITLPDSLSSIGTNAFIGTSSTLQGNKVSMPAKLKQGSNNPLYGFTAEQWSRIIFRTGPFSGSILTKTDVVALGWENREEITLEDWKTYAPNVTQLGDPNLNSGDGRPAPFSFNSVLRSIVIPKTVTKINFAAFHETPALRTVTFESGSQLTHINGYSFRISGITTITIPSTVTVIGEAAFDDTKITSINIPKGVTTLDKWSFRKTSALQTITFEANSTLSSIGQETFWLSGIRSIVIPKSVTSIGTYSFLKTFSLRSFTFEENSRLQSLGHRSFQEVGFSTLILPDSLRSIQNTTFINSGNIINITMSSRLRNGSLVPIYGLNQTQWNNITWRITPFTGSTLTKFDVINLNWHIRERITANDWKTNAANVISLGNSATSGATDQAPFSANTTLKSIVIPASVVNINYASFLGATSLTTMTFDGTPKLATIGTKAFENSGLTTLNLPDSVKTIAAGTFTNTTALTGPNISMSSTLRQGSLTELYGFTRAQWDNINWRIAQFRGTTLLKADVINLNWHTKTDITQQDWTTWAPLVTKISSTATSGAGATAAFGENTTLRTIFIPAKITEINFGSFYNTTSLQTVTIAANSQLNKIENAAFNLSALTAITIPAGVTTIGDAAFQTNENLASVTFENGSQLTSIGNFAFYESRVLRSINIPNKVTSIGTNAFQTSGLRSINVPNSVTTIGADAFKSTIELQGNQVSMLITLRQESSSPLYGFNQEQWNAIQWRSVPFLGEILLKSDVVTLGWNLKTEITLDDWSNYAPNVTTISNHATMGEAPTAAFENNTTLQRIQIPSKITSINFGSFFNTTSLTSVTFENGSKLATIENAAFRQSGLTSIIIPSTVTSIGNHSFQSVSTMETITFGENSQLTNIGIGAFDATGIKAIIVPDLVTTIGEQAFQGTSALIGQNVSMQIKLKKNSSTALYGFTKAQWDVIDWRGTVNLTDTIRSFLVDFTSGSNIVSMPELRWKASSSMSAEGRDAGIGLQYAIGTSVDNLVIPWGDFTTVKRAITTYSQTKDILKTELNIFAKLYLPTGTGAEGDMLGNVKYTWNKVVTKIYDNQTGTIANLFVVPNTETAVATGEFIRTYSRVLSTWADPLSAEGNKSSEVKIINQNNVFDLNYYAARGIKLEVSPDAGKTWTAINAFNTEAFNASTTNKMQFRLKVIEPKFYEIYETVLADTTPSGIETPVIQKDIIAKIELTGISAANLITSQLAVSGTTHNLVIVESDQLYTVSGLDVATAKTFFEIKYSYDNGSTYLNKDEFITALNRLRGNELNALTLANFKVIYQFTTAGLGKYYSSQVANDPDALPEATQTLVTTNVKKTIDVTTPIADIPKIRLTGSTESITWTNIDSILAIGTYVKVEYGTYVRANDGTVNYVWSETLPTSIYTTTIPSGQTNFPMAIRFLPKTAGESVEIGSINSSGNFAPANTDKGYEVDVNKLVTIIRIDTSQLATKLLLNGYANNLNGGATSELIESPALALVDATFRTHVELQYQISILADQWFTLDQLKQQMKNYIGDFTNSTSGIIIFNNGTIPGVTIKAKFVAKDPEKFTVNSSPEEVVELNTSNIKTNIDLREYVKVLQTQKVIPSGTSSADLGKLLIPGMPAGNVLFGGRTYEQIAAILSSSIDIQFKAPGFNENNWVPLANITAVNFNNELYIRFVVKEGATSNIELSLVAENDYANHLTNGFKLKLNLPIEIQVNAADLVTRIVLGGNTKNLTINDDQVYADLIATDAGYEGKVQILYTIGKTPMHLDPNLPEKIEFTKTELIRLLTTNTIDVVLTEKQITARYALAPGIDPEEYRIKDTSEAILNVENVLLYINKSNYYELASKLKVSGTSSEIVWGPELGDLTRVLSKGLILQFSTDSTAATSDPVDSEKWTITPPTSISPSTKFLVVRLMTATGYIFEEPVRLFNVNTSNVLLVIAVQSNWLEQVALTGNTKDIVINETTFEQTLTTNNVPGKEFIVVQYYFGGTVPANVEVPLGTEWFTAAQLKAIFLSLKGAKSAQELILLRNSIKARYSLNNEGYQTYRLNIDGVFIDEQFALQPAFIKDLVTPTINTGFQGYINLDLVDKFTPDNFEIVGSDKKPVLNSSNAISAMLDYYKNPAITPFDIYYTNTEGDFSNTSYKLFGENGFITNFDPTFIIKLNNEGQALPIWFKIVARNGYQVWENNVLQENGKIIQITNINIRPQIANPLTVAPEIRFVSSEGTKFYQGQGSLSVYDTVSKALVDRVFLNKEYPNITPDVLKLQYNVNDILYTAEELEAVKLDETKWSDNVPTNLRVGQYVMVRVAVNNPIFTMTGGDAITPQTRVHGLVVRASELQLSPELILTNTDIYGFTPLDGQTKIETATIVADNLGNYLGADLQMSVNSQFYTNALGTILTDSNGIPIIKRDPTGAEISGYYTDAQGQEIIDSTGNKIPILTIQKQGSTILAPPLSDGEWRSPMKMSDWSVPGSFSQEDTGLLQWRLFEGQTVRFTFVPRVGQGTNINPDFTFDSSTPAVPEIKLSGIKYIIPTNGVSFKFDQNQLKTITYASDDGGDIPYTGSSFISSPLVVVKVFPNYTEEVLTGTQIEEKVKEDYGDQVVIKMQLTKKNGTSQTAFGTDISQFHGLQNGDVITVSFEARDSNFSLPKPIAPLTISVKNLFIKPLDKDLFKFLRPNFTGALNGSGSFNIRVTNPNNPSDTNEKVLGIDQWYEYQVWNPDKTIKTEWTRDESKINNLVNGDKIEWKLVNQDGVFENDYYNTLLANTDNPEDIKFRVVNVVDKIEETVQEGIGNSSKLNPDQPDGKPNYPEKSGWVVSGLKIEINLDSIQQQKFEQALTEFQPTFSGVNQFGQMSSNISNDTPISPDVVIVWYAVGADGMPRRITDFKEAGLSNGDQVWAAIAPSPEAIANNLIIDESISQMTSKVFVVSGLTTIVNSTTQTLLISLITASSVLLVGTVGSIIFIKRNGKLNFNKKFKK